MHLHIHINVNGLMITEKVTNYASTYLRGLMLHYHYKTI